MTVRVIARAGRPGPSGIRDGALLIRVGAAPVDGASNAELIALISKTLGVPKAAVSIEAGEHSRVKRIRVNGVSVKLVNARFNTQDSTR